MQFILLHNNCFSCHSNHSLHPPTNGGRAPGDCPTVHQSCFYMSLICLLRLWIVPKQFFFMKAIQFSFPQASGASLSPRNQTATQFRELQWQLSKCPGVALLLTSLCCWQNHHLMLQGAMKEKFALSRRKNFSICASLKEICDLNKLDINHAAGCRTKILKLLFTISHKTAEK